MPTFIVRQRRRQDRAWPLQRGETLIGRGRDVDLALPNVSVSRKHARVVVDRGVVLEDLGTHNGTRVNGRRIERVELATGDRVQIGPFELVYLDDATSVFGAKLVSSFPNYLAGATDRGDATFELSKAELAAHLRSVQPLSERAALLHGDGTRTTLSTRTWWFGRGLDVEVGSKSKVAEIRWDVDHHVLVRHTFWGRVAVNGRKVKEHPLEPGDQLEIGEQRFKYDA